MTDYIANREDILDFVDNCEKLPTKVNVDLPSNNSFEEDSNFARSNIINLSMQLQETLSELHDVALSSQHPRAYEVFANLANTMLQSQKDLLELHETKHKIMNNNEQIETKQINTTNNIAFIGSSTELEKMLLNLHNK